MPFPKRHPSRISYISFFIFNLLINHLLHNKSKFVPPIPNTISIASCADDLVIIGYSQNNVQKALDSFAAKANRIGLKINVSKTDYMLIYKNTKPKFAKHKIILKLNNQKLNQVQHEKYLWVVSDTHLTFKQHLQHVTKKNY